MFYFTVVVMRWSWFFFCFICKTSVVEPNLLFCFTIFFPDDHHHYAIMTYWLPTIRTFLPLLENDVLLLQMTTYNASDNTYYTIHSADLLLASSSPPYTTYRL